MAKHDKAENSLHNYGKNVVVRCAIKSYLNRAHEMEFLKK